MNSLHITIIISNFFLVDTVFISYCHSNKLPQTVTKTTLIYSLTIWRSEVGNGTEGLFLPEALVGNLLLGLF